MDRGFVRSRNEVFLANNWGSRSYGSSSIGEDPYTLFVDNLPNSAEIPWFRKLYSNFGRVLEAVIPNKRSMKTGNKFGFVRFNNHKSAIEAIAQTSGLWVGRRNLIVKWASFNKRQPFKESNHALSGNNRFTPLFHDRGPTDIGKNSSFKHDRFTYRENSVSIFLQPSASEWLWRSAIAELKSISSPDIIKNAFSNLNFNDVKVRSMGGKFMIITFQNRSDRNKALANQMIKDWFSSFKHWNGEAASLTRLVWLKIRGMPLNAWEFKSFKRIAEVWGELLTLDRETIHEESFDVGRLLMVTSCNQKIDDWINITVKGRNYSVHVWEEECYDPFDVNGIKDSDHLSNFCNKVQMSPCKDGASQIRITTKNGIEGTSYYAEKGQEEGENLIKNAGNKEEKENLIKKAENKESVAVNDTSGDNLMAVSSNVVFDQSKKLVNEEPSMELFNDKVVETQFSKSAESQLGSHSEEVQETPIQKELQVSNHKDIVGGIALIDMNVNPTNVAAIGEDHALCVSSYNNRNNAEDKQLVTSTNVAQNEECEPNQYEINEVCPHADFFDNNNGSIQAAVKGVQGKKRRKNIDEILGNSKVNKWNRKGGKGNKKCVVLRSAIAAAALSASVSTEGISNRNKIILSEAQTIRQMNKLIGYKYDGDDEEVLSKIAELEAQEKEGMEG